MKTTGRYLEVRCDLMVLAGILVLSQITTAQVLYGSLTGNAACHTLVDDLSIVGVSLSIIEVSRWRNRPISSRELWIFWS